MSKTNEVDRAPVHAVVIRDLAIADAQYVMTWLLQIDEIRRDLGYGQPIPENIVELCKRALSRFDVALQADADTAVQIPLSDAEIDRLVRNALG